MTTELNVGDVVYYEQSWGDIIKCRITRVTPHQAFIDEKKFHRSVCNGILRQTQSSSRKWGYGNYYIETTELKTKYKEMCIKDWFDSKSWSDEELKKCYKIFNNSK